MIGRRLIPRISILVHPSVSDRAVVLIHPPVRTCVRTTAGGDLDSSRELRRLVADPYATAKGNLRSSESSILKLSRQASSKKRRQREYDAVSVAVTSALRCSRARCESFLILTAIPEAILTRNLKDWEATSRDMVTRFCGSFLLNSNRILGRAEVARSHHPHY